MSNDTTTTSDAPEATDSDTGTVDWKAEAEKYKALHKKQEERAKANADAAKELDRVKASSMTELERAVAETEAKTRSSVLREVGMDRAADYMRVAAAGRPVDIEAIIEGTAFDRFLDDDGQPDVKKIRAHVDRIAPPVEPLDPVKARVPVGVRDSGKPGGDRHAAFAKFIDDSRR